MTTKRVGWPLATIAFLVLFVGMGFSLYRLEQTDEAIRAEVKRAKEFDDQRAYELCLISNETRKGLRESALENADALIAAARRDDPNQDEEQINLYRYDVYSKAQKRFPPRDCKAELKQAQAEGG